MSENVNIVDLQNVQTSTVTPKSVTLNPLQVQLINNINARMASLSQQMDIIKQELNSTIAMAMFAAGVSKFKIVDISENKLYFEE